LAAELVGGGEAALRGRTEVRFEGAPIPLLEASPW
jgi:hypothetical protein